MEGNEAKGANACIDDAVFSYARSQDAEARDVKGEDDGADKKKGKRRGRGGK